MSCNVHGNKNANEVHNYSAKKAQKLGHPEMTVDPECTCDVGCTGPAKEGKGNTPVGPGAETKSRDRQMSANNDLGRIFSALCS